MTRQECFDILNNPSDPRRREFHHLFYKNRNACKQYYIDNGLYKKGMVLHHKILGCTNYEEWKIDEIVPMTHEEHGRLHVAVYKQGIGTKESLSKAHAALAEKYKSGELTVWNKGKKGVQVSVRKGKTGKDFPFLCASKNGKSGGWNKGKKMPPKTKKHLEHMSVVFKEKSLRGENDKFIYSCVGTIFINNGVISKRIKNDAEIPEGWKRGRLSRAKKD